MNENGRRLAPRLASPPRARRTPPSRRDVVFARGARERHRRPGGARGGERAIQLVRTQAPRSAPARPRGSRDDGSRGGVRRVRRVPGAPEGPRDAGFRPPRNLSHRRRQRRRLRAGADARAPRRRRNARRRFSYPNRIVSLATRVTRPVRSAALARAPPSARTFPPRRARLAPRVFHPRLTPVPPSPPPRPLPSPAGFCSATCVSTPTRCSI